MADLLLENQQIGNSLVLDDAEYVAPTPNMKRTVRDVVRRALRLIGAYGSGDNVDAPDILDGLLALNMLIDSWSAERLLVYTQLEEVIPLVFNQGVYPLADRPIRIEFAFVRDMNQLDLPVGILSQEKYAQIALKTIGNTYPCVLWYDDSFPTGQVTLYPLPQTNLVLHLGVWQPLSGYVNITDEISLPPGYEDALTFSLAEVIAPEYDRPIPPVVSKTAATARARIKSINLPAPLMTCEFLGSASSGGWDGKAAFFAGY